MDPDRPDSEADNLSREEVMSALFANMVSQQANMALMFLGKIPNPETGETVRDLEAAGFFISQLEMLEAKTQGNLSQEETNLLHESLTTLRMTFVEVADQSPQKTERAESGAAPGLESPGLPGDEESKKKFSKKY